MPEETAPPMLDENPPHVPRGPDWLPTWELAALALGDFIVLVLFAAVGRGSHGLGASQRGVVATLNTAAPFMLAWLIVGIVVGTYRGKALYPPARVLARTLLAALIAGPLGVIFRALWLGRPVVISFILVATAVSGAFLAVWRLVWSRFRRLWWPELP